MKKCPKCGCRSFIVTAHVTQTWLEDENGNFIKRIHECEEVTHRPDDDDMWECSHCGHNASGAEFNTHTAKRK